MRIMITLMMKVAVVQSRIKLAIASVRSSSLTTAAVCIMNITAVVLWKV